MDISLVIPLFNEEESLIPLVEWISEVMGRHSYQYEIVFIDDGSTDKSWEHVVALRKKHKDIIKATKFRRNYGKAAALNQGFKVASGRVVITMDADLQDSPEEIDALYKLIVEDGYDLISGWKKKRHDPLTKTLPSKLFNSVARRVSNIQLHDFNCGLKAYKNEVVKDLNVYGDMHRWMPVLAKWEGYSKIGEKVVEHRKREFGVSKFGAKRLVSGFLDLLTIFFVGKFNKKPMHFFGTLGIISIILGILALSYLTISKLIFKEAGIQDRPLFFFGILTIIIGMQLFLTGFIAELITSSRAKTAHYNIEERIE